MACLEQYVPFLHGVSPKLHMAGTLGAKARCFTCVKHSPRWFCAVILLCFLFVVTIWTKDTSSQSAGRVPRHVAYLRMPYKTKEPLCKYMETEKLVLKSHCRASELSEWKREAFSMPHQHASTNKELPRLTSPQMELCEQPSLFCDMVILVAFHVSCLFQVWFETSKFHPSCSIIYTQQKDTLAAEEIVAENDFEDCRSGLPNYSVPGLAIDLCWHYFDIPALIICRFAALRAFLAECVGDLFDCHWSLGLSDGAFGIFMYIVP